MKTRIRVKQGYLGSSYFYKHEQLGWLWVQIAPSDIERHGNIDGYIKYLRDINCEGTADRLTQLISL